jgi:hypothetical protein
VLTARSINRTAGLLALTCALAVSALSGGATARANDDTPTAAALAQERYYSSYGKPQTIDARTAATQAQERYYSSYGEPEPLTLPQPAAPSDDTRWPPVAFSIAIASGVVAAGAAQLRRLRGRRRATRLPV